MAGLRCLMVVASGIYVDDRSSIHVYNVVVMGMGLVAG